MNPTRFRTILFVIALCGGCLVVPRTETTARRIGTAKSDVSYGAVREVALATITGTNEILVEATSTHTCEQRIFDVVEVTEVTGARADLGQHDDSNGFVKDPRGAAFAFLLAPVTLPVSALITGVNVLASSDSHSQRRDLQRTDKFECKKTAANVRVEITFPSGRIAESFTDQRGKAAIEIPESEPDHGTVLVRSSNTVGREVAYTRPPSAASQVRSTLRTCGATHHVSGTATLRLAVDARGFMRQLHVDAGDGAFSACLARGLAATRFPPAQRSVWLKLALELPATGSRS